MALTVQRGQPYEYLDAHEPMKQYFSVSQVLRVLDPDLYQHADPEDLEAASLRGRRVHLWYVLLLGARTNLVEAPERPDDAALAGYYDAIQRWLDREHPTPIRVEEASVWVSAGVAGTPDSLVRVGDVNTIVELKTTSRSMRLHRVQVQAYARLEAYRDARELRLLYVRPDGTYQDERVQRCPSDEAAFLSAASVLRWRQRRYNMERSVR